MCLAAPAVVFLAFCPGFSERGETEGKKLAKRVDLLLTRAHTPASAVALILYVWNLGKRRINNSWGPAYF